MAIRVLHVVEALGIGGGVENGIANLVAHMDGRRFEHVLCAVFQLGTQTARFPKDRVAMHCLNQERARASSQVGALSKMIRETKPDIVHSRNWGAIESVFAARWLGARTIHSEHGVESDQSDEPFRRRCLRRLAYQSAHRVFAVSNELQASVARRAGFDASRIGVIRNGVDRQRFRADLNTRAQFRAELGIGANEFVMGCVGRMNPVKDLPTMLAACERLAAGGKRSGWKLLLVGDGPERARLEEQARSSEVLRGRVQFTGNSERVPELLNALDVYVLPSLTEGISNSLLEAMAMGIPVVATGTGGTPEVIEEGRSGLLFAPQAVDELAAILTRLYQEPAERERLANGASERIRDEFSIEAMVRRYDSLYSEVAPAGSAKQPARAAVLAEPRLKD